jgi:hypothetical protein
MATSLLVQTKDSGIAVYMFGGKGQNPAPQICVELLISFSSAGLVPMVGGPTCMGPLFYATN